MWFAVKTVSGEEENISRLIVSHIALVRDAFVPKQNRVTKDPQGKQRFHIAPLISGILFADFRIDISEEAVRSEGGDLSAAIWGRINRNVTPRGYFCYRDERTGEFRQIPGAHLLSGDPKTASPDKFIWESRIPDADMEVFQSFLNEATVASEDVQIVCRSFHKLAREGDTVRVMTGPWAGVEGVVVQKASKRDGNAKDRHLEVRFGNSYCLSLANVRRFDLAIVRKAQEGDKARTYRLWREADSLTAMLQRTDLHRDDAPQTLRDIVATVVHKQRTAMDEALRTIQSIAANDEEARRLYTFATSLPSIKHQTTEQTVAQYIPDYPIRAFLTPATGDEAFTDIQTLPHRDFKELIVPVNLQPLFLEGYRIEGREDKPLPKAAAADYAFNAHVAVFTEGDNAKKAIVSWGTFYDAYAAMGQEQREGFLQDLQQKGYHKAHALFATGHPIGDTTSPRISFTKIGGIGGFTLVVRGRQQDAAQALVAAVAPVAVEFWQKERLRSWQQLLLQSVFIRG